MFYPLSDSRSRAIYKCDKSLKVFCADYHDFKYTSVNLPVFSNKTSSIWGIELPLDTNMFTNIVPVVPIETECVIMNITCHNMGHYLAMFYKHLCYVSNTVKICVYEDILPENIKIILKKIYSSKVIYLNTNTIYTFSKLHLLFTVTDNNTFLYYDNSVYTCRQQIINYIDSNSYEKKQPHDKIIIIKKQSHSINKGFSKNVLIGDELLKEYINNGYVEIDTYKTNILDIIYYIRSAKEIIISYGTTLYCHMPYFKKNTNVTVLFNTEYMNEVVNIIPYNVYIKLFKQNTVNIYPVLSEYCANSMFYLIFLEKTNYRIGFINTQSSYNNISYIDC